MAQVKPMRLGQGATGANATTPARPAGGCSADASQRRGGRRRSDRRRAAGGAAGRRRGGLDGQTRRSRCPASPPRHTGQGYSRLAAWKPSAASAAASGGRWWRSYCSRQKPPCTGATVSPGVRDQPAVPTRAGRRSAPGRSPRCGRWACRAGQDVGFVGAHHPIHHGAGWRACRRGVPHRPLGSSHNTKAILDNFGADGWELVQVVEGPGGGLVAYFQATQEK